MGNVAVNRGGRTPKGSWGVAEYRRLAGKLANMDPSKYDTRPMTPAAVVRKLAPKIQAKILETAGDRHPVDIYRVHSLLLDAGIEISLAALRRALKLGPVAEPQTPGRFRKKKWNQQSYDRGVREVCAALPREEVPDVVWQRFTELERMPK